MLFQFNSFILVNKRNKIVLLKLLKNNKLLSLTYSNNTSLSCRRNSPGPLKTKPVPSLTTSAFYFLHLNLFLFVKRANEWTLYMRILDFLPEFSKAIEIPMMVVEEIKTRGIDIKRALLTKRSLRDMIFYIPLKECGNESNR